MPQSCVSARDPYRSVGSGLFPNHCWPLNMEKPEFAASDLCSFLELDRANDYLSRKRTITHGLSGHRCSMIAEGQEHIPKCIHGCAVRIFQVNVLLIGKIAFQRELVGSTL